MFVKLEIPAHLEAMATYITGSSISPSWTITVSGRETELSVSWKTETATKRRGGEISRPPNRVQAITKHKSPSTRRRNHRRLQSFLERRRAERKTGAETDSDGHDVQSAPPHVSKEDTEGEESDKDHEGGQSPCGPRFHTPSPEPTNMDVEAAPPATEARTSEPSPSPAQASDTSKNASVGFDESTDLDGSDRFSTPSHTSDPSPEPPVPVYDPLPGIRMIRCYLPNRIRLGKWFVWHQKSKFGVLIKDNGTFLPDIPMYVKDFRETVAYEAKHNWISYNVTSANADSNDIKVLHLAMERARTRESPHWDHLKWHLY